MGLSPLNFRELSAILVRLCLIASVWHAPIPWVHCHGPEGDQAISRSLSCQLSHHLALFHPEWSQSPHADYGWHCHWAAPYWWTHGDDSPDATRPGGEKGTFEFATMSSASSPTCEFSEISALWNEILVPRLTSELFRMRSNDERWEGALRPTINSVLRC